MATFVDGKVYEKRKVYDRFGILIKDPPQRYQNPEWLHVTAKIAALRASSSVVTVIARRDRDDKISHKKKKKKRKRNWITYFSGSGIIFECEEESVDATYATTVLTPASPLLRDFEIEVDVALSDGKLCKSQVVACDYYYNLAVLRIMTDIPLQPANMRSLDDGLSIHPTQPLSLDPDGKSFRLRPHSNLFKILPDDKVIALSRRYNDPYFLDFDVAHFSMERPSNECHEFFYVKGIDGINYNGGPVINYSGEMIGILFHESSFLPSNVISRWWKHYKTHREFRRPWLGFEVANPYTAQSGFLEQLLLKFPGFSTGLLVVKVEEGSPAYCSGIRDSDVIVQINGVLVQSTLEFFEKTWDKVGEAVELEVIRESTGGQLNISTTIGEVTPEKFPK
ncbi:hypothetical protein AgCh_000018 [Apium graveolens]